MKKQLICILLGLSLVVMAGCTNSSQSSSGSSASSSQTSARHRNLRLTGPEIVMQLQDMMVIM
jgi:ABC-type glycerol-3-phosphate transport system substrate-binding protein